MAKNIFNLIRDMVKRQIRAEKSSDLKYIDIVTDSIRSFGTYPQGAIKYLTGQGALKVESVSVEPDDEWGKAYVIKFKDINLDAPFFKSLKRSSVYVSELMEYNDKNRADDNKYMSNGNIVGYEAYFVDETRYEKLSREDSCVFEMFAQWLGYNNYQDFIDNNKLSDSEIDIMYENFTKGSLAPDWELGEDDQTLEEIEIA